MKKEIKGLIILVAFVVCFFAGYIVLGLLFGEDKAYAGYGAYVPEGCYYTYIEYQIQEGDTIDGITNDMLEEYPLVKEFIGYEIQKHEIIRVNGLKNPNKINEGHYLLLPIVTKNAVEGGIK